MKKITIVAGLFLVAAFFIIILAGCGKEEKNQKAMVVGNWTQYRNRAYILLVLKTKGKWGSTVRIADVTSKIVSSKGNAEGTWHIEDGQMIFTVTESDIEQIWEKNATIFLDIVEITETTMKLAHDAGRVAVWKKTTPNSSDGVQETMASVVPMGPVVVNLNKNRSNDKDRYLCMNLNLELKELMPEQALPLLHPRAREAAIVFLSSLVFKDVKDFDAIKKQNNKLVDVLNPYMDGVIDAVQVEHVVVATDIDKVDEFIIEHTLTEKPEGEGEGEEKKVEE